MASIVVNGDTSGAVTLSAPATAGTVTVTLPATSGTMLTTASSTGISGSAISSGTVPEAYGGTGTSTGYYGFKNRIINGAMVIDQRNAGAVLTSPTSNTYSLDRWRTFGGSSYTYNVQQNAGSVTPPVGFANYLGVTSTAASSLPAGGNTRLMQNIEGYNLADLNWGSANAQTAILSFWVRSSLTGTFGMSLWNENADLSYPASYTINSANTWEKKTITITGPTSGTWNTTNGSGVTVNFSLGSGSTYTGGTVNTWNNTLYFQPTGSVNLVETNGATLYITGVQFEKGSTATSFDYRPYGTELALCQRYFCSSFSIGTAPAQNAGGGMIGKGSTSSTTEPILTWQFPVSMRIAPTVTTYNPSAANNQWSSGSTPRVVTSSTAFASIDNTGNQTTAASQSYIHASATSEL
jgi:hypothetical protein